MSAGAGSTSRETPERVAARRASKRDDVRASVERVALELFREHGFDGVTVEEIAAECGVGPTTFYRYFGTKDGVVFAYQGRWLDAVRAAVDGLDVDRPRPQQLRDLLATLVRSFDAELDDMELRDQIVGRDPSLFPRTLAMQREWEQQLADSLARRRRAATRGRPADDRADDAAEMLAVRSDAALVSLVMRLGFRTWRAGACPSFTHGTDQAWRAVFEGMGGPAQD